VGGEPRLTAWQVDAGDLPFVKRLRWRQRHGAEITLKNCRRLIWARAPTCCGRPCCNYSVEALGSPQKEPQDHLRAWGYAVCCLT
jgi:hypothetical protein